MFGVATPARAQRGPLLIGAGLAVILLAHLWPVVPIATAFMLVGSGATWTLAARPRTGSGLLVWLNLSVYSALVALAIGAQAHTAMSGPAGRVPFLLMVDHTLAVVLLATRFRAMFGRS